MAALPLRCLIVSLVLLAGRAFAQERAEFETQFRKFAASHCVGCHGPEVQKRRLRLDRLPATFDDKDTVATWVHVLDRLLRGDMPPKSESRPPEKDTRAVMAGLERQLHEASLARQQREGRVV